MRTIALALKLINVSSAVLFLLMIFALFVSTVYALGFEEGNYGSVSQEQILTDEELPSGPAVSSDSTTLPESGDVISITGGTSEEMLIVNEETENNTVTLSEEEVPAGPANTEEPVINSKNSLIALFGSIAIFIIAVAALVSFRENRYD